MVIRRAPHRVVMIIRRVPHRVVMVIRRVPHRVVMVIHRVLRLVEADIGLRIVFNYRNNKDIMVIKRFY